MVYKSELSTENELTILPALPHQWPEGQLRGVRKRGGGSDWKQGRLSRLTARSDRAMRYRVVYSDRSADVDLRPGKPIVLDGRLQGIRQ